jgi:hypothetical protein
MKIVIPADGPCLEALVQSRLGITPYLPVLTGVILLLRWAIKHQMEVMPS